MAADMINNNSGDGDCEWKNDKTLEEELNGYVEKNLKRKEILDFVKQRYPQYPWSLRSISRRMKFFGIKYVDDDRADLGDVEQAVREELDGPGQLLGYRALHKKIR
eukprot:gene9299-10280_t